MEAVVSILNAPMVAPDLDESHCVEGEQPHMLHQAAEIVKGGRNSDHKDAGPGQSFELIVPIFNMLTGHNLSVGDGAKFMMILKMVRQETNPKTDNMMDLAGYASILNDITVALEKELKE
jgi:hypothetical protein